jgi:Vitamin K epoxide reductase family
MMGGKEPPGFDGNPTAWPKRILVVVLAFAGLCVSVYLAIFQVGIIPSVWDPFLRSPRVLMFLGSPDASLGALAYGAEIVLTLIGGRYKWRTMPWTVLAFGFLILSGALVSVLLILMQAFLVGAWCTLCLASAAISFAIFVIGYDEPLAGLRYLGHVREAGGPVWRALWGLGSEENLRV